MTRVSLKEAYDNKDVIAQIYAIRDTAESAVDTSEQAVTTANTASEHVDALVPQVEGAVQNANSASASAQASAQTVAGYDGRLTVAEGAIDELESDVNAVTLRVTTAEGDIVTIQGRVTALETADGQNVKINAINDYAVGLTGNQKATGYKNGLWVGYKYTNPRATTAGKWLRYMAIPTRYILTMTEIIGTVGNNGLCYAKAITSGTGGFNRIFPIANQPGNSGIKIVCMINQSTNKMEFWIYIAVANNVNGLDFYNEYVDDQAVTQAEYFNTEHDTLPAEGYTTAVYILGSA